MTEPTAIPWQRPTPTSIALDARDEALERGWLERAEQRAGHSGFAEHAGRRLEAGERAYGDRWARVGLACLLDELREEAADLGTWSVLALQTLEREPGLDARRRRRVRAALQALVLHGRARPSGA